MGRGFWTSRCAFLTSSSLFPFSNTAYLDRLLYIQPPRAAIPSTIQIAADHGPRAVHLRLKFKHAHDTVCIMAKHSRKSDDGHALDASFNGCMSVIHCIESATGKSVDESTPTVPIGQVRQWSDQIPYSSLRDLDRAPRVRPLDLERLSPGSHA